MSPLGWQRAVSRLPTETLIKSSQSSSLSATELQLTQSASRHPPSPVHRLALRSDADAESSGPGVLQNSGFQVAELAEGCGVRKAPAGGGG